VSGSDLFNPDFAALARAYGWHGEFADSTADAVAALERCIAAVESAGCPALLHLKLPTDVITSRTTLSAIREAALKSA
jgi:acetolactate synthase-1/2/3 large subunit